MARTPLDQFADPASAFADPADADTASLDNLVRAALANSRPASPAPTQLSEDEERQFQEWLQQGHSFHDLRGIWRAVQSMIDGNGNGSGDGAPRTARAGGRNAALEQLERGSSPRMAVAVRATPPPRIEDYNQWGLRAGARRFFGRGEPPSKQSAGFQKGGRFGD
jgi:hypothetical protein